MIEIVQKTNKRTNRIEDNIYKGKNIFSSTYHCIRVV